MKPRRVLIAALGVTLIVAGCGSSGTSTSSGTAPPAAAGAPNVKSQLLSLSDLPAGWSVDNSNSSSGSTPACLKNVKSLGQGAKVHDEASFQQGANGFPGLNESLNYAPGASNGELNSFAKTLNGCGVISFTTGGHKFTGTIGALSFPPVGDASKAYQLIVSTSVDGLNVTAGFDIVAFRKGNEVAALLYSDLGTPDVAQVEQFVRQAAAKIPAGT